MYVLINAYQLTSIYHLFIDLESTEETQLVVCVPSVQLQKGASNVVSILSHLHSTCPGLTSLMVWNMTRIKCEAIKSIFFRAFQQENRYPYASINIYCPCKMPETIGNIIHSDKCDTWYHFKSVGLETLLAINTENWFCKNCNSYFMSDTFPKYFLSLNCLLKIQALIVTVAYSRIQLSPVL